VSLRGPKLPASQNLNLKLPPQRNSALRDPLVYGLRSNANSTGEVALAIEKSAGFGRGHVGDVTQVANLLQPKSQHSPTDTCPLRFKLRSVEFSERLLHARTVAQKTQEQVAHACGISHAAISKAESGKTDQMVATNLFAIADFLGCDARWLATGEGQMSPPKNVIDELSPEQRQLVLSVINSLK